MYCSARRARSNSIALLMAASTSKCNHREDCLRVASSRYACTSARHGLSLPLLASSKATSAREVLEEESEGGNSGPKDGRGFGEDVVVRGRGSEGCGDD